jgi:hypothetical protein
MHVLKVVLVKLTPGEHPRTLLFITEINDTFILGCLQCVCGFGVTCYIWVRKKCPHMKGSWRAPWRWQVV